MADGGTVPRWAELGPGFVRRVLVTTLWLGAVSFLLLLSYRGSACAIAWGCGVSLGLANLLLLDGLMREMIRGEGGRKRWLAILALVKFPAIYAIGGLALWKLRIDPLFFLGGFSLFLLVTFLKIAGRLLLGTRWLAEDARGPGGPLLRRGVRRPGGKG